MSKPLYDVNNPPRILICGDRKWVDEGSIAMFIDSLPKGSTIIHGGATGADKIAGKLALEFGYKVKVYEADWGLFGPAAGPIRNRFMLNDSDPTYVVAFHDDLSIAKGTIDMIAVANMANVPVLICRSDEEHDFYDLLANGD